mmetsp:Transcript_15371/g.43831  ORF Transcript_15371/g.43831 Transcript_15371/m.43831 type:complete len:152 (-) Transcript_15371:1571-2026(-)
MVDSRWAMTSTLRPAIACSSASCTIASEFESRALVASSNRSAAGRRTSARAIAKRCFWPPLRDAPRSPQSVSYPSGSELIKSCALAILAASSICCWVGTSSSLRPSSFSRPRMIFRRIERPNSTGSCPTRPIRRRSHFLSYAPMSRPSISI